MGISFINRGSKNNNSNIKLFSTVEEMQSSTGNKGGDIALIYQNSISNATVDSQFQSAIMPNTVVLPQTFNDYVDIRFRSIDNTKMFDCMGNLNSSRFRMDCYTDTGNIRIEYESSDGMTYTRTDGGNENVDFGTTIHYEMPDMWNEILGYFFQVGNTIFNGVFIFQNGTWNTGKNQLTADSNYVYDKTFYGKNGVEAGTITENISNSFADVNAEIVSKVLENYENMQPRILTDNDKIIDRNIYFIPTKKDGTPLIDISEVTNAELMFNGCSNLKEIPLINTSNVTGMSSMFGSCKNLKAIPLLNTSNVITMESMFGGCRNLKTIPLLNTSKVTNMISMFNWCDNLTEIPLLDTSKVTNMINMFNCCSNLKEIPLINTSNVITMESMFYGCKNLKTIPLLNTSNVTGMSSMFVNCNNLSDASLNTILQMCINAIKSKTKILSNVGLTQEQITRCQSLSNYEAFISAGWTTGY